MSGTTMTSAVNQAVNQLLETSTVTPKDAEEVTSILDGIKKIKMTDATVTDVLHQTASLLHETNILTSENVEQVTDILDGIKNVAVVLPKAAQNVLNIIDVVSQLNTTVLKEADTSQSSTNRFIQAVDDVADRLVLDNSSHCRLMTDTTAVEVWDLTSISAADIAAGLQLKRDVNGTASSLMENNLRSLSKSERPDHEKTEAAIRISSHFIENIVKQNPGRKVRLSMSVFAEPRLFQSGSLADAEGEVANRNVKLVSKVISATVTVDGRPVNHLGTNNVTTVFRTVQDDHENQVSSSHGSTSICVFWNFNSNGGHGAWSGQGCVHTKSAEVKGLDVCVCDHLTNFAVLLDVFGNKMIPKTHERALSYISYFGVTVSMVGLACIIISFLCIKKWRQGQSQQVLFNLALAIFLSWVVFLAGFTRRGSHSGCLAGAALLHYFILTTFLWMLVEGVLHYQLVCRLRARAPSHGNFIKKAAIFAWVIPLIPVIILLAIDVELYNGYKEYCWLKRMPFYYTVVLPLAVVMCINIVIYSIIVVKLCRRPNLSRQQSNTNTNFILNVRASVGAFVILGLNWALAFLAVSDARLVFQYLFCTVTAFQGLLLFLIFTARDDVVVAFWTRLYHDVCARARGLVNNAVCCRAAARDDWLQMNELSKQYGSTSENFSQ